MAKISLHSLNDDKEKGKSCTDKDCIPHEILYELSEKTRYIGDEEHQIAQNKVLSIEDKSFWKKYEKLRKQNIYSDDGKITLLQYHKHNYGLAK